MAYSDIYDGNATFTAAPVLFNVYGAYTLFKQTAVALWTTAGGILADSGSTTQQIQAAAQVYRNPVNYAFLWCGAFLADSAVRTNAEAGCTDVQVQAAADWILPWLA